MPYNPDDDLYTAEPKLLSTHFSCLPVFFPAPVPPPNYDTIMSNASYHRVPENDMSRVSMSSEPAEVDEALLLLDPLSNESNDGDDKAPEHKFVCHPTAFTRLIAIAVFIPAFVLLIVANRRRNLSAIIFIGIAIARNFLVLLHHILSRHIRIKIEFRHLRSAGAVRKPSRTCPTWLKPGPLHLLVDFVLVVVLVITTIIATQGSYGYYGYNPWYVRTSGNLVVPAVIVSYIGILFNIISLVDMGNPSNITITGGVSFNFDKGKDDTPERLDQPQVHQHAYRDVEAQAVGGLGTGTGTTKTGADSPVII